MIADMGESGHRSGKIVRFEDLIEFKMRLSSYQYSYIAARAQRAGMPMTIFLRRLTLRAAHSGLGPPIDYDTVEPYASIIEAMKELGEGEWVARSSIGDSIAALTDFTRERVYDAIEELLVMGILDGNINLRDQLIIAWRKPLEQEEEASAAGAG